MIADPVFFRDLAYVLVAAVLGAGLAWLARQPLILGYVMAGIVIGPLTPGPTVSDLHTFERFAEIGVVLLMFSLGIEFSLRDLLRVKWVAIAGAPLGMALSVGLTVVVGTSLGWGLLQATVVGMVLSVASTMVLARLLSDRGELHARHGRIMVGITLVEDLAVVVLIALIPALGALEADRLVALGWALARAAGILGPFLYLGARTVPAVLTAVARTRNEELFLLVALALAVGTAALTQAAGLSLALGAFLAGLLINQSDYAHEALARLLSLRDVFVALFFVTIGALIDPAAIVRNLSLLAVLVGLIVVGNFAVWTLVVWLFRYPLSTAILVGVGLTQIGEFSFIMMQVARGAGHVGADIYHATLAAALITILINAALMRMVPRWSGRLRVTMSAPPDPTERDIPEGHVLLCGFGRVGSAVAEAFDAFEVPYVAIEIDPDVVRDLRLRNVRCFFGDASGRRLLERAGTDRASLAIVAIPEIGPAEGAVRRIRALNARIPIFARAHTASGRDRLIEVGATEVFRPELEAAATLIRHSLRELALPRERVLAYLDRFRGAMEAMETTAPAAKGLPGMSEITIGGDGLADQSLRQARIRERFGVTVVAVVRHHGELVLHPSADTVLRPGDRLKIFGLPEQVAALLTEAGKPSDAVAAPSRPDGSSRRRGWRRRRQ